MTAVSEIPPMIANADMAAAWDGPDGDHWTEQAEHYERTTRPHRERLVGAGLIGTGDAVMDVGCGTGALTRAAARLATGGSALGVDLSGRMLERARELTAAEGVGNASYEQADAEVHPLGEDRFDVLVSSFGCMFFGDPARAFANLARALRRDGRVGLLVWRELADNEWVSTIRGSLAAGRTLPVPPAGAPGPFGLADADRVRGLFTRVGLVDVELNRVDEPMDFGATAEEAFDFVSGMGFTRAVTADLDAGARETALASLRDALAAAQTGDGVVFGSSAWLVLARKG